MRWPRRFQRLLLATHNAGKVAEMRELLAPHAGAVVHAGELGLQAPEEIGESFEAIASLKARAAADASGLPALADDSGLVVHALGGEPGVRSARWAGSPRDFGVAMQKVNDALGEGSRDAEMVCALALAMPGADTLAAVGRVSGVLVWPPRGDRGFGYEPMFQPDGATQTYGQMPRAEKHRDDPRARAFAALRGS